MTDEQAIKGILEILPVLKNGEIRLIVRDHEIKYINQLIPYIPSEYRKPDFPEKK